MTNIAIIPARGGSRRIPRKNIRMFHGKPIIAYSIETASDSGLFKYVYVSTDDDEIATVARSCGASVIRRMPDMAANGVGTQEVMRGALIDLALAGFTPDYACCIYATAPMMRVTDLCYGYAYLRYTNAPYVYSIDPNGADAGQWYWGTYEAFRDGVPLTDGFTHVVTDRRVCDINTEEDWKRAGAMYACLHASQQGG